MKTFSSLALLTAFSSAAVAQAGAAEFQAGIAQQLCAYLENVGKLAATKTSITVQTTRSHKVWQDELDNFYARGAFSATTPLTLETPNAFCGALSARGFIGTTMSAYWYENRYGFVEGRVHTLAKGTTIAMQISQYKANRRGKLESVCFRNASPIRGYSPAIKVAMHLHLCLDFKTKNLGDQSKVSDAELFLF